MMKTNLTALLTEYTCYMASYLELLAEEKITYDYFVKIKGDMDNAFNAEIKETYHEQR